MVLSNPIEKRNVIGYSICKQLSVPIRVKSLSNDLGSTILFFRIIH